MRNRQILLISFLVSMVVYFALTWPLGANFHAGIPTSNRPEMGGARYMIPGDPLQFLYQLWMLADSFTGQTPLFYHVYEFNQGNDQALYNPGSYYFPFGLLYSAGYALGGRVIGWNLMLCVTVWLIYWATWRLMRRFTGSELTAGVAALPSILLPYFYVSLLGGSPTGMGMLWVPLIFWGVDVAIRDRKLWGGVLAGTLLFICSWVDLHVFFFVFLATPVWGLMCVAFDREKGLNRSSQRTRRGWPLVPILGGMIGAYLQTSIIKASLDHTLQSKGRSLEESLGYALRWTGWFDTTLDNQYNIIYIGVVVAVVLIIGFVFLVVDAWRNQPQARIRLALFVMVLAAIGGIAILSLGPNTPFDSEHRLWKALRAIIPPYKMIRQPAKIYCILTPFLGIALVMVMDRFNRMFTRRIGSVLLAGGIVAGCCLDYGRRLDPTLCLLDYEQGGYHAIAKDAAASGRENRALAIPLWPGDSHWNSITEYYATLYRTKMLNGYSPSVSRQYFTEIFQRFEAINMGLISDDTLDGLLEKKIGYLLIQEDSFPEKVSPFPVSQTLRELIRHPRLQFLARDKAVWSFKILSSLSARKRASNQEPVTVLTAWQWSPCDVATGTVAVVEDTAASDVYMRLIAPGGQLKLDSRTLYPVEGLRFLMAVRGYGKLEGSFGTGLRGDGFTRKVGSGHDWEWLELPAPVLPRGKQTMVTPVITATEGVVEVGMTTLMAGPWKWLQPGESMTLPADSFFRAGYSDPVTGVVSLDADRVQADVVFYAPILPVLPGRYRVSMKVTTAAKGAILGDFSVMQSDGGDRVTHSVMAGQEAFVDYRAVSPKPLRLEFRYSRKADLAIRSVTITRVE
ncbi:MAG: hypothetical protein WCL49_09335 [bacterium]